MIKIFILLILLISNLSAIDKVFFLPIENKLVTKEIESQIKNAKNNIDIAMYNFSYKKFSKLLEDASARGVKVKIYYFKKKSDFSNNIEIKNIKDKLHVKLAIIDKKIVIFGSANWTEESFEENYEVIYISDRASLVKDFNKFYNYLEQQ
ncbi:MAG: phospholipase D-like domain-containing protein [Arcobacteraceae bacterium]